MTGPAYATREDVLGATDYGSVIHAKIDRAIFSRSRLIDEILHRHCYPLTEAVTYSEYDPSYHVSDVGFWLNRDLQSVSGIMVDGSSQSTYTLLPKEGPPYNRVTLSTYWSVDTIITGVWGFTADTVTAGALAAAISDTTGKSIVCSDGSLVGVGDQLFVDDEAFIVTDRSTVDTTANLNGALTAAMNDQTVTVTDGTLVKAGEVILVESEKMLVTDIVTHDLTVDRAYDGSTLAAHDTAKDVYAYRTLTVERGATGTTAATHLDAAAITKNVPPGVIRDWCIAEAVNQIEQESSGYARIVGEGDSQRESTGAGLKDARYNGRRYIRQRMRSILMATGLNPNVKFSGGMFENPDAIIGYYVGIMSKELANQAALAIQLQGQAAFRYERSKPTWAWRDSIKTRATAAIGELKAAEVHDSGLVYGPWLEGEGSRNKTSSFKGYRTFKKVAQEIERKAPHMLTSETAAMAKALET